MPFPRNHIPKINETAVVIIREWRSSRLCSTSSNLADRLGATAQTMIGASTSTRENADYQQQRRSNEFGFAAAGIGGGVEDVAEKNALRHAHRHRARGDGRRFEDATLAAQQEQCGNDPQRQHGGADDQWQQVDQ